jgi:hypothetical protein
VKQQTQAVPFIEYSLHLSREAENTLLADSSSHATKGVADNVVISPHLQVVGALSSPWNIEARSLHWELVPTFIHACVVKKQSRNISDGLGNSEEVVNWIGDINITTKSEKQNKP